MKTREKTVAFYTLGCKLNQFETYDIERQFVDRGYRVLPFGEKSSVYVVNTCTVTGKSDYRCRQTIRKARRNNPDATVIAVGCYAQTQPGRLAGMPEVDYVLGNDEKGDLFDRLNVEEPAKVQVAEHPGTTPAAFGEIDSFGSHTRAFVKIQDGCNSRCSYCVVPLARGPNRSRPGGDVISQVKKLTAEGYREIVLTGIHLGTWGRDLSPRTDLAALLGDLTEIPQLTRLRLSSIEPTEFSPALIESLASPRICRHLHIPLQSGSAEVLKAMRRPYDPERYTRIVEEVTSRLPDLGLGADVIAGFPGERVEDFEKTFALIEALPLSYLHVFPYSERPGTAAADLPDQVPPEEKERRAAALRKLGKEKAARFQRTRIGRTYQTLIERRGGGDGEFAKGITGNYLKVLIDAPGEESNTFHDVTLTGYEEGRLYGKINGRN